MRAKPPESRRITTSAELSVTLPVKRTTLSTRLASIQLVARGWRRYSNDPSTALTWSSTPTFAGSWISMFPITACSAISVTPGANRARVRSSSTLPSRVRTSSWRGTSSISRTTLPSMTPTRIEGMLVRAGATPSPSVPRSAVRAASAAGVVTAYAASARRSNSSSERWSCAYRSVSRAITCSRAAGETAPLTLPRGG
jgi:hypothetical protein